MKFITKLYMFGHPVIIAIMYITAWPPCIYIAAASAHFTSFPVPFQERINL